MPPDHVFVDVDIIGTKVNHALKGVMVDTGATYSVFPKEKLDEVGAHLEPGGKVTVVCGNGSKEKADVYSLRIRIGNREAPIFAATFKGAGTIIGVQALESLGFRVNPVTEKLEETRPRGISYL